MTPPTRLAALCALAVLGAAAPAAGPTAADLFALKEAGLPDDGDKLRDRLAARVATAADRSRIDALVARLGSDRYAEREAAHRELAAMGAKAVPRLTKALTENDPEARSRARKILHAVAEDFDAGDALPAAARVLAARRTKGAAAVLLDTIDAEANPHTREAMTGALRSLSSAGVDPALAEALGHASPARRAAAGAALAGVKGPHRAAVEKLLADPDDEVRLKVATALLEAREAKAVPVLVGLMSLPAARRSRAEDLLRCLAGGKSPRPPADGKAWVAWYASAKANIDVAATDFSLAGATTVTAAGDAVRVHGPAGVAWEIKGIGRNVTAAALSRYDRVVVGDNVGGVSEIDASGRTLWHVRLGNSVAGLSPPVLGVQRCADGATFAHTRNTLFVLGPEGEVVGRINRPSAAAHRYADGSFALITEGGEFVRLGADGAQTSSAVTGVRVAEGATIRPHFLPGGGVVVPDRTGGRVVEFDRRGRKVREFKADRPLAAFALPGGNVLVGVGDNERLAEIDPATGKSVATVIEGRMTFIDRR